MDINIVVLVILDVDLSLHVMEDGGGGGVLRCTNVT